MSAVLLGGGYPWQSLEFSRAAADAAIVANDTLGLSLSPLRDGARGLDAGDGSLGALTLPRGVAVSGTMLFTLTSDGDRVLRYDPVTVTLAPLPEVGCGGVPDCDASEPRRFRGATNIAVYDRRLYVTDPAAHRVQVFDVDTLALVAVHEQLEGPVDVAAGVDGAYILDRPTGRVLRDRPGRARPEVILNAPHLGGRWDRIAVDRDRRLYLRDAVRRPSILDVFEPPVPGRPIRSSRVSSPDEVRERFPVPLVRSGPNGRLDVSPALLDPSGLRATPGPHESRWHTRAWRYVIDRETRTVRVHLHDGRLRHRFGPFDADGRRVTADTADVWRPVDATVLENQFFLLDARYQAIHVHRPDGGALQRVVAAPPKHPRQWTRIASDGDGCLLLWDGSAVVDRVDPSGALLGTVERASVVARFQRTPDAPVASSTPTMTRDGVGPVLTRPDLADPIFERRGVWVSQWIDSGIYNCQWDRLLLDSLRLPPGSSVTIRTRTAAAVPTESAPTTLAEAIGHAASWQTSAPIVADPQPEPPKPPKPPKPMVPIDCLVLSAPGQYLQLQIELAGDGLHTPVIGHARILAPRQSWLQYLPATYSRPDEQRLFLERFLAIAESTWSALERGLESFEQFLDPAAVPKEQLASLARWLDLSLEGTLTADQNRQVLAELPRIWRTWGTVAGIRAWVRVHLAALSGVALNDLERAGLPGIVEAFVERRHLWLNRPDTATLPTEAIWSPAVERRFQVGVFDQLGEVELVSAGDPSLDVFRRYAHRFRVYVPSIWVRTAEAEAVLRRAIDLQRPAHTTFELVLVEPAFRVGEQSTIALDTVVGGVPPWHIECPTDGADPSQAARRLGYDTVVGGGRRKTSGPGGVLGSGGL